MVACKVILAVAVVFVVVAVVQIQGRPSDIRVHDMTITDDAWNNTLWSKSMTSLVTSNSNDSTYTNGLNAMVDDFKSEIAALSKSMNEKSKV